MHVDQVFLTKGGKLRVNDGDEELMSALLRGLNRFQKEFEKGSDRNEYVDFLQVIH